MKIFDKIINSVILTLLFLFFFSLAPHNLVFAQAYHVSTPNIVPATCTNQAYAVDCQKTIDNDLNTYGTIGDPNGQMFYTVPANAISLPADATNIQACFNFDFSYYVSTKYSLSPTYDDNFGGPNQSIQWDFPSKQFTNCRPVLSSKIDTINTGDTTYWTYFWGSQFPTFAWGTLGLNHLNNFNLYYSYDTDTQPVNPVNHIPVFVHGLTDQTISPGNTFSSGGAFADQDSTSWTATVDYGDGSGTQPLGLSGQSFGLNHTYPNEGTYTVTVSVTDDGGAVGTSAAVVTVKLYAYHVTTPDVAPASCTNFASSADCQNTMDNNPNTVGSIFGNNGIYYYTVGAHTFFLPSDATNIQLCFDINFADHSSVVYALGGPHLDPNQGTQWQIPANQFSQCRSVSPIDISNIDNTDTQYWFYIWAGGQTDHLASLRFHYVYDSNSQYDAVPAIQTVTPASINLGDHYSTVGTFTDPDSVGWTGTVDYGDGTGVQQLSISGNTFSLSHDYGAMGDYTVALTVTDNQGAMGLATTTVTVNAAPTPTPTPTLAPTPTPTPTPVPQLTALAPAKVWVGLKNSDDVGIKFDLLAEAYANSTLVSSGELDSVTGGSSGFNNAHLQTVPFNSFSSVDFPSGTSLSLKVYARNACTGSGHNSGTARLWYNDSQANSQFGSTINGSAYTDYLLTGSVLGISAGSGPKATVDIAAGAKCSAFKSFGTWVITP